MTTDRELMQQALDALEAMQSYAAAEKKGLRICDEAIEALRARLAQPEQEWQGLTDEEIKTLWDDHIIPVFNKQGISPFVFARAIEAKLKEKNGYL